MPPGDVIRLPVAKYVYKAKATAYGDFSHCSCVNYAKDRTGFTGIVGAARNWPKNSDRPVVGGVVITSEGWGTGHVGIVASIQADGIWVDDANFSRCKVTHRFLPFSSGVIMGYWR